MRGRGVAAPATWPGAQAPAAAPLLECTSTPRADGLYRDAPWPPLSPHLTPEQPSFPLSTATHVGFARAASPGLQGKMGGASPETVVGSELDVGASFGVAFYGLFCFNSFPVPVSFTVSLLKSLLDPWFINK